jgi:hypothetical protein
LTVFAFDLSFESDTKFLHLLLVVVCLFVKKQNKTRQLKTNIQIVQLERFGACPRDTGDTSRFGLLLFLGGK